MAFVTRSEIKTIFNPNNDSNLNLGPGAYLPLFPYKKTKKNKFAFSSSSPRKINIKVDDVPGPGSYNSVFINEKKSHLKDISAKLNPNSSTIYKALESQNFNSLDPVQIWINGQFEKLGFLSKIKRFKGYSDNDLPGPGAYLKLKPNSADNNKNINNNIYKNTKAYNRKSIKELPNKSQDNHSPNKVFNYNNSNDKNLANAKNISSKILNPYKVETIPNKQNKFGFDYDENGSLVRNSDPEISNQYKGDKQDSVGPGNYDTIKAGEWLKKGTSMWSKSKTEKILGFYTTCDFNNTCSTTKDKSLTRYSLNKKNNSEYIFDNANNSNNKNYKSFYSSINNNRNLNASYSDKEEDSSNINNNNYNTSKIYKTKNNFYTKNGIIKANESQMSQIKSKGIRNVIARNSKSFDEAASPAEKNKIDVKILKEKTKKIREVLFMNHTNKLFDRSYLLKSRGIDLNPGPGYYHDTNTFSGFNFQPLPESRQIFGSNSQRFPKIDSNENVGPAYYHKELPIINKIKAKELKEKLLIPQMANIKKYKPVKIEEKELPGPGYYHTENFFDNKKRVNTAEANFGSFEPRFKKLTNKKDKYIPGPGSYLGQAMWGDKENPNLFAKMLSKPTFSSIRNNFNMFHNTAATFAFNRTSGKITNNDNNNATNQMSKTNHTLFLPDKNKMFMPPVGAYNPDQVLNLDYKIAKKCNKPGGLNEAPFNITKSKPRFEYSLNKPVTSANLGPGIYYKEQQVNHKQIKNPFNNGDIRFREMHQKFDTSPGHYNTTNDHDWNKKTFNILYV